MAPFAMKRLTDLRPLKLTLEILMKNYPKNPVIAADSHFNPRTSKSVHAFVMYQPENCDEDDNVFGLKSRDDVDGDKEWVGRTVGGNILGEKTDFVLIQPPELTLLDKGPVQAELSGYRFTCNEASNMDIKNYFMVIDSQRIYDLLISGLNLKTKYKLDIKQISSLSQAIHASNSSVVLVKSNQLSVADYLNKFAIGKVTKETVIKEYDRLKKYRIYSTSSST